jgi:hypothetical protein
MPTIIYASKRNLMLRFLLLLPIAATFAADNSAAKLIINEDFESTPVGQIPKGFTKNGSVEVVEGNAHSGKHCLQLNPAVKGPRTLVKQAGPELTALGGQFWGRLYFKVKLPAPLPLVPEGKTTGSIHTTFVSGKASSPLFNDPIEIRMMGNSYNTAGTYAWLYNVQPSKRKEFGVSTKTRAKYTDEWTLAEWSVDNTTQSYHFYINGTEVADIAVNKGAGKFEGAELPANYDSMSFGWLNYQPAAGEGFTVWIDDLALSKSRIGGTAK